MRDALNGLNLGKFKVWSIVGVTAAAILLLLSTLWGGGGGSGPSGGGGATPALAQPVQSTSQGSSKGRAGQDLLAYEQALAARVSGALSQIQGAGRVTVSLDLSSGPSYLYAFNQTTRKTETSASSTSAASTDTSNETQLATTGSGQSPVLTQEVAPKVVGALIVATGAKDPIVREELTQAVEALLGLPAYEIEVLPGGGGR